jgi:hypothetical protein
MAGPPQLEPATRAGLEGALVYRGVLAGATATDPSPPSLGEGTPYAGPDEDLLLASALTPFLQFKLRGYYRSCLDHLTVELRSADGWEKVARAPAQGQYVLDGKAIGYTMCDVVSCLPIQHDLRVPLVQIVPARAALPHDRGWPSLESRPLRGEIRVRFPYYGNASCTSQDVAEQRVIL